MDNETGEFNYRLQASTNAETGENEFLMYSLDQETGEEQYCSFDKICNTFRVPNPFRISRYTTNLSAIVQTEAAKHKSPDRHMEFITAIVFLIPTFIIFTPLLGVFILSFEVVLHRWCHRQNAKLGLGNDGAIYYQSPLHTIYQEFCSKCIAEEDAKKINKIQNIRYNRKRYTMEESLRRVVA